MQPAKVSIGEAVSWIGGGWRIFTASPGMWLLIGLVDLLISAAAQFVPILGGLVAVIITPVITAGLMYAAREAGEGREVRLDYLFQGFREPGRAGPLFGLGGIYLGSVFVIILLCVVPLVMMIVMTDFPRGLDGVKDFPDPMLLGTLLVFLLALALFIPVLMALYYAVPLVMFDGMPVWTALGSSLKACLRNFWPLTVFGLALLVPLLLLVLAILAIIGLVTALLVANGLSAGTAATGALVAVVLGALLMFLISIPLIPILTGMNYCSYRDVYRCDRPGSREAGMAS